MAYISFAPTVAANILTQVKNAIEDGDSAGVVDIYANVRPTDASTAVGAQTRLGTLTFSDPCGTVSGSTLTMSAITQDSAADATGVATLARISSVNAGVRTTVKDIDVTAIGGGGTMQMNTTSIVIGGPILISSFVLTA